MPRCCPENPSTLQTRPPPACTPAPAGRPHLTTGLTRAAIAAAVSTWHSFGGRAHARTAPIQHLLQHACRNNLSRSPCASQCSCATAAAPHPPQAMHVYPPPHSHTFALPIHRSHRRSAVHPVCRHPHHRARGAAPSRTRAARHPLQARLCAQPHTHAVARHTATPPHVM